MPSEVQNITTYHRFPRRFPDAACIALMVADQCLVDESSNAALNCVFPCVYIYAFIKAIRSKQSNRTGITSQIVYKYDINALSTFVS